MLEVFRFVEHVFAENAFEQTRRSDRADVMNAAGLDGMGQGHGVAGADHVRRHLDLGAGAEVIHGGEMEKVVDLALELLDVGLADAEAGLQQVADDGDGATPVVPERMERVKPFRALVAGQEVDRGRRLFQEFGDQPLADESGCPGDKINHCCLLVVVR